MLEIDATSFLLGGYLTGAIITLVMANIGLLLRNQTPDYTSIILAITWPLALPIGIYFWWRS